jgi:hypothetical protein
LISGNLDGKKLFSNWCDWVLRHHIFTLLPGVAVLYSSELKVRVWNRTRDTVLGADVDVADTSAKRRTGLLNHERLEPGQGLWISPCESVHTFFMKFPIDLVYVDRKGKVRKVRSSVPAWRLSACLPAHSVVELPAGTAERTGTQVGDELVFDRLDETATS